MLRESAMLLEGLELAPGIGLPPLAAGRQHSKGEKEAAGNCFDSATAAKQGQVSAGFITA
jgi:hypothetical protein